MSHAGYEKTALQELLADTPYKTTYLADKLVMSPNAFRYLARNPHIVSEAQARALAEILGMSKEEIIAICTGGRN